MPDLAPLIGLYSPAAGSGKTTLATAMAGLGWRTVKFAGPLKAMFRALMEEAGASAETIAAMLDGDLKTTPDPRLCGKTPRHAMQTLGTEWGRGCLGSDVWVRLFLTRAYLLREDRIPVVCDDMRFPNEAEAIRNAGGMLVRITRPGVERATGHASEGGLDDWDFDLEVTNDACSGLVFGLREATRVSAAAYAFRPPWVGCE